MWRYVELYIDFFSPCMFLYLVSGQKCFCIVYSFSRILSKKSWIRRVYQQLLCVPSVNNRSVVWTGLTFAKSSHELSCQRCTDMSIVLFAPTNTIWLSLLRHVHPPYVSSDPEIQLWLGPVIWMPHLGSAQCLIPAQYPVISALIVNLLESCSFSNLQALLERLIGARFLQLFWNDDEESCFFFGHVCGEWRAWTFDQYVRIVNKWKESNFLVCTDNFNFR